MTKTAAQKARKSQSANVTARLATPTPLLQPNPSPPVAKRLARSASNRSGFRGVNGKGDYGDDWKTDLQSATSKGFSKLGSWLAKNALSLFGLGDYSSHEQAGTLQLDDSKIASNTLVAGTSPPVLQNKGQAFVFRHREYVGDVHPSVEFTNTSYPINPGNSRLFPWLCVIAQAFEEFQLNGMIAEYKPLVSAVSANAIGAVVYSTEYNPTKPPFTSKVEMENYEYATSCAPHHVMMHAIECKPSETTVPHKQILSGDVPPDQDPRMYNWGNFQIATQGQANDTGVIGEIWLTYEILCFKPVFSVGRGLSIPTDKYAYPIKNADSNMYTNAAVIPTFPYLGSLGSFVGSDGIIYFPPNTQGDFLLSQTYTANAVATNMVFTAPTNVWINEHCELLPYFLSQDGARDQLMPTGGIVIANGSVTGGIDFVLRIHAPSHAPARFGLTTALAFHASSIIYLDLTITQLNSVVTSPVTISSDWREPLLRKMHDQQDIKEPNEVVIVTNQTNSNLPISRLPSSRLK